MSDQSDDNRKPNVIGSKIKSAWNGLNNFVKILSGITGILAVVLLLISQIDEFKSILFKSISDNTKEQISQISNLPSNEREIVLTECLDYDTKCLKYILKACEKMSKDNEAMQESLDWINQLNEQLGNDDVFDICIEEAVVFLKQSKHLKKVDDAENGFNFYIKLLKNFESDHQDEVQSTFIKFTQNIEAQPLLHSLTKKALINKID